MKTKTLRIIVCLLLIFSTLFLSNYLIDYYKIKSPVSEIITTNSNYDIKNGEIVSKAELDKITSSITSLEVDAQNNIDSNINNNTSLDFFTNTETLTLKYAIEDSLTDDDLKLESDKSEDSEDKEATSLEETDTTEQNNFNFNITDQGIKNIEKMPKLKNINFKIVIDDYVIKQRYGFEYKDEEEKEFKKEVKAKYSEVNSGLIKTLEDQGYNVKINVEIVDYI